jgi:site-specific DNA-methyltransferase (adenine-specific)
MAARLIEMHRLLKPTGSIYLHCDPTMSHYLNHREDIPERTDLGAIPRYNAPENKTRLYGEQEGNCAGCETHFEARHLTIDHIIARSKGGTDHLGNLQLLCGNCNAIKGDRGMEYLVARLAWG